jgi:hypothetical protein
MTADQLRKAQAAFDAADAAREAKRERRNQLVRSAREQGWSHQQISDATGLTRSRLSQIVGADRAAA